MNAGNDQPPAIPPTETTTTRTATMRGTPYFGGYTDRAGRAANEDTCTTELMYVPGKEAAGAFFAVADGMGGGSFGSTASQVAIGVLPEQYFEAPHANPLANLQHAVLQANRVVYATRETLNAAGQMGSTVVAAVVVERRLFLVSVGDSRAYLLRSGQLTPLTRDDNWGNQQIELGTLSQELAHNHPDARLLTHVLGHRAELPFAADGQPDNRFSYIYDLYPDDVVLLCSDGLEPALEGDVQAVQQVMSNADAPRAARKLVEMAVAHNTNDNATAVVYKQVADTVPIAATAAAPPAQSPATIPPTEKNPPPPPNTATPAPAPAGGVATPVPAPAQSPASVPPTEKFPPDEPERGLPVWVFAAVAGVLLLAIIAAAVLFFGVLTGQAGEVAPTPTVAGDAGAGGDVPGVVTATPTATAVPSPASTTGPTSTIAPPTATPLPTATPEPTATQPPPNPPEVVPGGQPPQQQPPQQQPPQQQPPQQQPAPQEPAQPAPPPQQQPAPQPPAPPVTVPTPPPGGIPNDDLPPGGGAQVPPDLPPVTVAEPVLTQLPTVIPTLRRGDSPDADDGA